MSETPKRKGGRPAVNSTPVTVRLPPDQLARLDAWREAEPDAPSRPEAIRRMVESVLRKGAAKA